MRSDELYKFSDDTLTRLLTSLKDITNKNNMEYLPKRRWSILEKKRARIMIKAINKLQKERRIMRSLEKFIVKELQERCIIKAFKLSYQEKYEHVGPKSQDHKMARLQDDVKRLCLVDDLKKFKITFMSRQRYKSKPKVKDHYINSQVKD
ncbi:hypothetical protein Tco_0265935 [Tanacetum coccineum]